jgi:hypothetical protein
VEAASAEFRVRRGLLRQILRKKLFSPTWSAVMRLLPGKSCFWRNPGIKSTGLVAIFKKFRVKMAFKLNLIWNKLNSSSIHSTTPNSSDYPFKQNQKVHQIYGACHHYILKYACCIDIDIKSVSNKHTGGSNSLLISGMPIAHA